MNITRLTDFFLKRTNKRPIIKILLLYYLKLVWVPPVKELHFVFSAMVVMSAQPIRRLIELSSGTLFRDAIYSRL